MTERLRRPRDVVVRMANADVHLAGRLEHPLIQESVVENAVRGFVHERRAVVNDRLIGEIDVEHHVHAADDRLNLGLVAEALQRVTERRGAPVVRLVDAGPAQNFERGESGGAGDGIAAQRADLGNVVVARGGGIVSVHNLAARGDGGEREASADDLPQRDDVRRHAVVFLRAPVGEAEARHHLVEHEQNAVAVGEFPQPLQEARLRRDDALNGLGDDRGDFVVMPVEQGFDGVEVVERRDEDGLLNGLRNARRAGLRLRERRRARRREAHQRVVVHSVKAALELDDLVALAEGAGEFERVVGRLRPRADEPDLLGARDGLDDALRQFDGVGVLREERRSLRHRGARGLNDLRMRVAQNHRAGAEQIVNVLVAADVADARARSVARDEGMVVVEAQIAERPAGQRDGGPVEHRLLFRGAFRIRHRRGL